MTESMGEGGYTARVSSIIESILLVSTSPVKEEKIKMIARNFGKREIDEAILALGAKYGGDSGILLEKVAGGYQLRTNPSNQEFVRAYLETRPPRLSRASLETVSIIAYKQPVTRAEIEDVRGVDSQGAIKTLLDRRLIRVVGKKEVPGKPFLFGTTRDFLELFGLEGLSELPSISEIGEILGTFGQGDSEERGEEHLSGNDEGEDVRENSIK